MRRNPWGNACASLVVKYVPVSNVLLHPLAHTAGRDPRTHPIDRDPAQPSAPPQQAGAESNVLRPEHRPGSTPRPANLLRAPRCGLLRRLLLGDPRVPHRRRNDSALLATALALAAHGAVALAGPYLATLFTSASDRTVPQLRFGNDAPFEGSGDAGSVVAGSDADELPDTVPAFVVPQAPPPLKEIATSPDDATVQPAPPTLADVTGTTDPAEFDPFTPDPLARPASPTTMPAVASGAPPRSPTTIGPDAPREPSPATPATGTASTASATPPSNPARGQPDGAASPTNPTAAGDTGRGAGGGGGRTGDPRGTIRDVSWVRIRPAERIAGRRAFDNDLLEPDPAKRVWQGVVGLRFDVNPRGVIVNVRVERPCANDRLNHAAARDFAENTPPKHLWNTADNSVDIEFVTPRD